MPRLADVRIQRDLGHSALFIRVERLFGQEEAVRAVDIAGGSARLSKQVEARWGVYW